MARTISAGMPERQNRLIFIGAILLATLAGVLVFVGLSGVLDDDGDSSPASFAGSVNVVVAAREIPAGTTITGDDLTIATLPENGIVDGALFESEGLEGLVVRQNMARGEQLTSAKVGQGVDDDDKTLSAVVPPGLRAIAVEVDETTVVGGFVVAGDRVDVIAILEDDLGPSAQTILQDVEVLAVAQDAQEAVARLDADGNPIDTGEAEGSISTRPEDAGVNEDADTVTLAVTPEDAALVALSQDQGTVWLVLRGQGDVEILPIGPIVLP